MYDMYDSETSSDEGYSGQYNGPVHEAVMGSDLDDDGAFIERAIEAPDDEDNYEVLRMLLLVDYANRLMEEGILSKNEFGGNLDGLPTFLSAKELGLDKKKKPATSVPPPAGGGGSSGARPSFLVFDAETMSAPNPDAEACFAPLEISLLGCYWDEAAQHYTWSGDDAYHAHIRAPPTDADWIFRDFCTHNYCVFRLAHAIPGPQYKVTGAEENFVEMWKRIEQMADQYNNTILIKGSEMEPKTMAWILALAKKQAAGQEDPPALPDAVPFKFVDVTQPDFVAHFLPTVCPGFTPGDQVLPFCSTRTVRKNGVVATAAERDEEATELFADMDDDGWFENASVPPAFVAQPTVNQVLKIHASLGASGEVCRFHEASSPVLMDFVTRIAQDLNVIADADESCRHIHCAYRDTVMLARGLSCLLSAIQVQQASS